MSEIFLLCDDDELSADIQQVLGDQDKHSLTIENTINDGLEKIRTIKPELAIIKFDIENLNPAKVLREIRKIDPSLIIAGLLEKENPSFVKELLGMGVYDFFERPINNEKLSFLVKKGIHLHELAQAHNKLFLGLKEQNSSLQRQNTLLGKRVEESTNNLTRLYEDLRSTYLRTIKALAEAIDARDHYTHSHSENVEKYALEIAQELNLAAKDIELISEACQLHDLGKIGIQDSILIKSSALTKEEWKIMKSHPEKGAQILQPLTFMHGVIDLIRQHHENYDGSGYPDKLKGDQIFLGARIIHLADAYEAMISARSYRKTPLTKAAAVEEIKRCTGTQFDPKIVEVFLKVLDKL